MTILQLVLLSLLIQAPVPIAPPASIRGVLCRADTGVPIADATVELRRSDGTTPQAYPVTTAADGSFQILNVRPGDYRLLASRAGFLPSVYGQRRSGGAGINVHLDAMQNLDGMQMTMTAAATISGRITDEHGDPMSDVEVKARMSAYQNGRRVLKVMQSATTNDLGEYRLFDLSAGAYFLSAKPPEREVRYLPQSPNAGIDGFVYVDAAPPTDGVYMQTYYPGTPDSRSATAVEVAAGGSLSRIDINVVPLKPHHVRGQVPGGGAHVILASMDPVAGPSGSTRQVDAAKGPFNFDDVAPGQYLVVASSADLTGSVRIDVRDSDLEGLTVVLGTGVVIPTHVSFDDHAPSNNDPLYAFVNLKLISEPEIPGVRSDTYEPFEDGHLGLEVMVGGSYRITFAPAGNAPALKDSYIKSIRMGERDVWNDGLQLNNEAAAKIEIVIGTKPGSVNGMVVDAQRRPALNVTNATVVLVPDIGRRRASGYKVATTDSSGRFQLAGVPPGDYLAFAWDDVEIGAWQDPEFLKRYEARGTRVHMDEGGRRSITLPMISDQ